MAADMDNLRVGSGTFSNGVAPPRSPAANQQAAARRTTVMRGGPRPTNSGRYATARISGPPTGGQGPVQPVAPDINTFLNQDTDYQQQLREFGNALTQFLADVGRRKGSLESDYGSSQKAMNDQKGIDLNNLEADYGSRGILRSGLYGKAVGDYNTEFNTRMTDLTNKEKEALGQLDQETGRFKSQQELQSQAAKEAAVRRRAEKYGV